MELGVTPFEEIDLLVKWLGPESSKSAKSIRAANAHDPPRGLQRIYDRLQERYGRPEMVESAMKRKLNSFPTLTNNDNVKLYDLLDILTEIESVMLNPQYMLLCLVTTILRLVLFRLYPSCLTSYKRNGQH